MSSTNTQEQQIDTTPGTFAWNELLAADQEGAKNFYGALFGWTSESVPGMDYTMFNLDDRPVAGMLQKPKECDGPPTWVSYIHTPNVAATLAKAVELGADELKEVTDVPGMGSFAVIKDPQGTVIAFWQAMVPVGVSD